MLPVEQPFKTYTGLDGKPLDNGYVYFGAPNQNPTTAPVTVFWDAAGTVPAAQPLRTVNGYVMRAGTPANVFFDGAYSELVMDSKKRQVFYARTSDEFSVASAVASFLKNVAGSTGSSLLGFLQAGVGAVLRTLQDKSRDNVNGADFGMIADWDGATGTNNAAPLMKALNAMRARGGGTLTINPGDYYLGAYGTSAIVATIANLRNTLISAYGARFIVKTTALSTPFVLVFDSPSNVVLAGAAFTDVGFTAANWGTANDRWGAVAVALTASQASSGFRMVDCSAQNMSTMLLSDQRANKRNLKNISVDNCSADTLYYGLNVLYVGDNLSISNFRCKDVRRTLIGYGMRNVDADINLYTSSGFLGSNAAVSIACEGQAHNDGYGILGGNGDVNNIRIKLNVFGFEAHDAYVHFYNQQADSTGDISNVSVDAKINLSSFGKNPLVGPTDLFRFDHELPTGVVIGVTSRTHGQISLRADVSGSITGLPISIQSVNAARPMTVSLCPSLTGLAQTYTISQLTNPTNTNIMTPFERVLNTLTPVGDAVSGSVTGLVSAGTQLKIGKRVFFNAQLSWTGHTGTGALRLNGLTFPVDPAFPATAVVVVDSGLAHSAGSTLVATLGGIGNTQVLFYEEAGGNITTVSLDPTVSALYLSGSYVTP